MVLEHSFHQYWSNRSLPLHEHFLLLCIPRISAHPNLPDDRHPRAWWQ
jgi:hypothetical protein